ncbi:MAG: TatD family hydrolase [Christensenellales bacterium]|jgi:TatD DNase family protein
MRLFDTHTHMDDPLYDEDREAILASLPAMGVERILICGANMASSRSSMTLADHLTTPAAIAAVGIHPSDADEVTQENLAILEGWLSDPKVVALGEIGLDYYYPNTDRDAQRAAFQSQLRLANCLDARVIFHLRDAWGDFFSIMRTHAPRRGIMHCWSGSKESAARCLDMGFMISFSGSLTFKNAENLRRVAAFVPTNKLLVETDCPYLAPVPFRGKRNQPGYVGYTCTCLAECKGLSAEAMAEITYENACAFFDLSAV